MKKIPFVLLGLSITASALAQQKLTLQEAINIALKSSYDIQLAKSNVDINTINNHIGIAGGLPTVSGTLSDNEQVSNINQKYSDASRNAQQTGVASNTVAAGVTGSMVLYNGYRIVATKNRLEQLQQQSVSQLNAQIQSTLASVMTKYYDVVRQQSYLKTIDQSIEVSKQRLSILQTRKDVGLSNNADVYQAQLDLNALVQQQQAQQLVIDIAKTDLLNLMSLRTNNSFEISDTIIVNNNINLDAIKSAIKTNPAVLAAEQQIQINSLIEKETAAQRYPSVRANTGFNFSTNKTAGGFTLLNQSYGPFIGVSVAVPIYNGSVFKRQQKIAEVNTKIAETQRDMLLRDFESNTMRSYQSYTNTLQQLKTEANNYQLSLKLLDLVLQRFQLGQATIIDVKQAQQSFENEGYRLVNLSYAAKAAEISLQQIANQLTF
ncbi:TolC family protein [Parasediminibacterium paludis]|uniref:TolC family protein n=1 Tax=Parasediminibacterium paludis TaxID=908966 RepID=A0ABV8Q1I8_9BACT